MIPLDRSRYDGFIFDLDGTLADSMPIHFRAWTGAIEKFTGKPSPFSEELFYQKAGEATHKIADWLNEKFGLNLNIEKFAPEKERRFLDFLSEVKPIAAVVELIKELGPDAKMAVASGGIGENVNKTIDALHLRSYFKVIVCADDVEHSKPAPDLFLLAARLLEVEPKRCIVFEDGEPGFIAAKAAGMDVIDVRPHYSSYTKK